MTYQKQESLLKATIRIRLSNMSIARVYKDNDCLYLIQDISELDTYERSKAIVSFCDKETKRFEKEIDSAILDIFEKNKINVPSTDKSVLKLAFDLLKSKGKSIEIVDLFKNSQNECCEFIKETRNHFVVILETEYICGCKKELLQCGVRVGEKA